MNRFVYRIIFDKAKDGDPLVLVVAENMLNAIGSVHRLSLEAGSRVIAATELGLAIESPNHRSVN
jgi:hypothetical protein